MGARGRNKGRPVNTKRAGAALGDLGATLRCVEGQASVGTGCGGKGEGPGYSPLRLCKVFT